MKPRTFCEQTEYRWSLLLTYSFDPIFFERLVLRDLARGGTHGVLVLADRAELERGFERVASDLRALGRSYVLARSRSDAGPFHPKIFLRLGRRGGLAWVGSGNLTHGGWGTNHELATAWRVGPGATDAGGWIGPLLQRAMAWTEAPIAHDVLGRMLAINWVRDSEEGPDLPLLLSDDVVLARQLETRWRGRRFTTLDVLTGSTDRTGRMLRWAHDTFGVERVRLAVEPGRVGFDQAGLADLPVDLRLVEAPGAAATNGPGGPLHAKLYWFNGPDGPGAVMGSPNCSAAGWLVPWRAAGSAGSGALGVARGNLEAALVYDRPDAEVFASALRPFEGDAQPAAPLLPAHRETPGEKGDAPARHHRLATLHVEPDTERLVATFEAPGPAEGSEVTLHWPDSQATLTYEAGAAGIWTAPAPETLVLTRAVIARASVRGPDDATDTHHFTPPLWLDVPAQLERALIGGGYHAPLDDLARPTTRSDHAIIDELRRIGAELLGDAPEFLDPLRRPVRRRPEADEPDEQGAGIRWTDPDRLILALDDAPLHAGHPLLGGHGGSLGIHGIFRAIFGEEPGELEDADDDDAAAVGPDDDEHQAVTRATRATRATRDTGDGGTTGDGKGDDGDDEGPPAADPEPDLPPQVLERDRRRFESEIEKIMEGLKKEDYGRRCTPRQLQMAAAFPVVAALCGLRRGFTVEERAMAWTRTVINLLLFGHGGSPALLDAVEARYRERDDLDSLARALGDGVLWVTLSAALCTLPWPGPGAALHRAVLLGELWHREGLRTSASPERIRRLARRYRAGPALQALRELARPAASCLQKLEAALPFQHLDLWTDPDFEREPIAEGDVLWSPNAGWALALDAEHDAGGTAKVLVYWVREGRATTFVVGPYWISVRQAAARDPALASAYDALREVLERIEHRTAGLVGDGPSAAP